MAQMTSDERGEIIEAPQASEVYERLPEPKKKGIKSDKVKKWENRIEVSRKIRDRKLKNLNTLIDFYENRQWHTDDGVPVLKDKTTVNMMFANIKKELPYLYFQNPTPIIEPTRAEFELKAFAMQELLKHYTKYNMRTELKRHVRLAILDAKFSFGCLKTSYTPRFGVNPNKGKPILDASGNYMYDEEGNIKAQPDDILISELYYIERCSPREMLIDANCRNFIERAAWVGQEIVKPLSYLKNHPLYKNTSTLTRNVELADTIKHKTTEEIQAVKELSDDDDTQLVKFVEIYDFENSELLCLPDNHEDFIREEKIDLYPYSFLKFNESPDNFYPLADAEVEKPLQQEINVGRSLMITHARRSARKYFYSEETFRGIEESEGIDALKDPEDMTLVKVSEYDKPPAPIQMATQDPVIYNNLIQSQMDFDRVVGSTEAERGLSERRKTGQESGYQESHGAVRRGDKQSLVADFIVDTYINLADLMQKTLTIPQAIKVIGKSGIFWTQVTRKDIQGEFFFDVNVSEMRPAIPEMERQELVEFANVLTSIVERILASPVGPVIFNIQGLVAEFAKSYPSINAEKILNMKVTPEQIAELAIQQMMQGGHGQITGGENQ